MQAILLYFVSVFCVIECIPTHPTSYVYRSDGLDHGYTRTFSTGNDQEFRKVIVKRQEIPLTVTSYSTYIIHPSSSNYGSSYESAIQPETHVFEGNYWPGKHVYASRSSENYIPEDNVNDGNDDEDYYDYEDNGEVFDDNEDDNGENNSSTPDDYVDSYAMNDDGQQYDDGYNNGQYQWYHKDDEDIEQYISKLFSQKIGRERNYDPYGVWYGKNYYNDEYYPNHYY